MREGMLLIACEVLSRALHPSRVLEAQDWSDANFTPIVEENNVPGDDDHAPLFNGGKSVIRTSRDNFLEYTFTPPALLDRKYAYSILARLANPGREEVRVRLAIDARAGPGLWSATVVVPPTGHRHEYVVLDAGKPVVLTHRSHSVRVTFLGGGMSLDAIVVRNRGTSQAAEKGA